MLTKPVIGICPFNQSFILGRVTFPFPPLLSFYSIENSCLLHNPHLVSHPGIEESGEESLLYVIFYSLYIGRKSWKMFNLSSIWISLPAIWHLQHPKWCPLTITMGLGVWQNKYCHSCSGSGKVFLWRASFFSIHVNISLIYMTLFNSFQYSPISESYIMQ